MSIDDLTLKYYAEHAIEVAERYNNVDSGLSDYVRRTLRSGARILDVGAGSGRDMHYLLKAGYEVYGVEPCNELRALALATYPELKGRLEIGALPDIGQPYGGKYDAIVCSAVLMHVKKQEVFSSAYAIRENLKDNGRLLISIPRRRAGIDDNNRDQNGRLFNSIRPEYLELLFERLGFVVIDKWDSADALQRMGYSWCTILFQLSNAGLLRPLDQIEGVLSRDKKTATYKLALFRALSEIAITEYNRVSWLPNGQVAIPLEAVTEKWLYYYWPLIESAQFIPQIRGENAACKKPLSFRRPMTELVGKYRMQGGITQFVLDYRSRALQSHVMPGLHTTLKNIANTIIKGPVKYAGGALETGRLFSYDSKTKNIIVDSKIWREFSLLGYWIRDAVILRWAELTSEIAGKEIKVSELIDLLLVSPFSERDVNEARSTYVKLDDVECIWTGKKISGSFDVDHVIPYTLWHNNDLWNLMPVLPRINNMKRDKLPSRPLLMRRKNCFIKYWETMCLARPVRFEMEVCRFVGSTSMPSNWKNDVFNSVIEAVEITAAQKGCERWEP